MKSKVLPFLLSLLFAFQPAGRAQDAARDADGNDGSGAVKVTITKHDDGSYTAMKTDPEDRSAESSTYNSRNVLVQTIVYQFDDQGRAAAGAVYSPKGTTPKGRLLYIMRYKYDNMNRISEVDNFSATDQLLTRQVYHYDAAGKSTKVDTYDAAGNPINTSSPSAAIPDRKQH